ncbi:MAG: S-formylglutathione hydrolase [Verrucomicrobia bacterium]|nr:S-formylglutathione hydrolase [Verrucomicrobiota bacterium]
MADSNKLEIVSENRMHGGRVIFAKHASNAVFCDMTFSVFLPAEAEQGTRLPVLWWLSGLTCTAENFTVKAGAQRFAAEHKLILIAPDTSPRGEAIANDDGYDLGQGAGFYVNATQEPWAPNFSMYSYVLRELPGVVATNFRVDMERQGIFGHSMGGHGALILALKNPGRFKSVSAFAPIVAPTQCPWGHKALGAYLGDDREAWASYDATCLVEQATERLPILIDQGDADNFLKEQLKPELFQQACQAAGHPLELRMQPGYDHSYYFISTFIGDHIAHHAKALTG